MNLSDKVYRINLGVPDEFEDMSHYSAYLGNGVVSLEKRIAELEALLGKWVSHDGHVCPSCGCPSGLQNTIAELEAERDNALKLLDSVITTCKNLKAENERLKQALKDAGIEVE